MRRLMHWVAVALATFAFAAPFARAEDYPTRPVRIMVGFAPGSSADITARTLAQRMSQILGQQFVVEIKPGAASGVAAEFTARAPKDGYTLFMASSANLTNQAINPERLVRHGQGLRADRAGHLGADHAGRASVERRQHRAGTDRAREVEAGRGALRLDRRRHRAAPLGRTARTTRRRQARARAVSGQPAGRDRPARWPRLDDVLADLGGDRSCRSRQAQGARLGDQQTARRSHRMCRRWRRPACRTSTPASGSAWSRPAGTPREIVDKLSRAVAEAQKSEDVAKVFRTQGFESITGGPDEFAKSMQSEIKRWNEVAQAAGLKR